MLSSDPVLLFLDPASMCFQNYSIEISDHPKRVLIASFIFVFSFASLILNTLIILAVCRKWRDFRGQLFTQFVLSMICAGTLYTCNNFLVSIPCTFNYCSYLRHIPFISGGIEKKTLHFSDDTLLIFASFPNTLSFIAYLLANFGFCIYRLSIVLCRFEKINGFIHLSTLYLPWILAFYACIDTTIRGCIKRFNRFSISYTYNCSNCNVWFGVSFIDVNFYAGQTLPIIMSILYLGMISSIVIKKRSGNVQKNSHSDIILALQYLLICIIQYLSSFLFYIVPKYGNGNISAVIAMGCIGVIDVGLNPLILLIFNSKFRNATKEIFYSLPCIEESKKRMSSVTIIVGRTVY